jgi:hypothetical protein
MGWVPLPVWAWVSLMDSFDFIRWLSPCGQPELNGCMNNTDHPRAIARESPPANRRAAIAKETHQIIGATWVLSLSQNEHFQLRATSSLTLRLTSWRCAFSAPPKEGCQRRGSYGVRWAPTRPWRKRQSRGKTPTLGAIGRPPPSRLNRFLVTSRAAGITVNPHTGARGTHSFHREWKTANRVHEGARNWHSDEGHNHPVDKGDVIISPTHRLTSQTIYTKSRTVLANSG